MFFCEYCKIFKSSFIIEDLLIIPFRNFYLMIDNWYFRVKFNCCKIRPFYYCKIILITFIKKETRRSFPVNFAKFLRALFYRTPPVVAVSFRLKSLGFINCFAINCFNSYLITILFFKLSHTFWENPYKFPNQRWKDFE